MRRAVTGVDASVAVRLEVASEWMMQSSVPMLLAHRKQAWQANAALQDLMQRLAFDAASWPGPLQEAIALALDQDHPAPQQACPLDGAWCDLYFTRLDPDTLLCILVDVSAGIVSDQRLVQAEQAVQARDMAMMSCCS